MAGQLAFTGILNSPQGGASRAARVARFSQMAVPAN